MKLFVDMDGVLADFERGYWEAFGVDVSKQTDNVDWTKVRNHKDFYLNLPPMPDISVLWSCIYQLNPIILTGVPHSVEEACANKTGWVRRCLGDIEVRCCRSSEKYLHAEAGDILIDDWEKYRHKWEEVGGIWITHTSALETVNQLDLLGVI
jgi:hypothetical protein